MDLTTSTPETAEFEARDPWLFLGKITAYAQWWAGSPRRPGSARGLPRARLDLDGLPPALMFCGTRDTLGAGLPAPRATGRGGRRGTLTYVEEPDLIHVYPLLPVVPEARRAWRQTLEFLR